MKKGMFAAFALTMALPVCLPRAKSPSPVCSIPNIRAAAWRSVLPCITNASLRRTPLPVRILFPIA